MGPTLKDVAARAGVSRSAVSRTYTKGASVSAETRRKVEKAAAELGYSPSMLASSLTTRITKLIGFVSDNLSNPAFSPIFDQFTRGLQERGFRPLLVNLADETDASASLRLLRQYSVDGAVVASSTLPPAFAAEFHRAGIPTVHCFGRSAQAPEVMTISVDNRLCGQIAAQALIARGYRRIGFLGGPREATTTVDRRDGFTDALAATNAELSVDYAEAYSYAAGRAAMRAQLDADALSDAYFCGDDAIAIGALAALREAEINVPGQVGLMGVNDMEMASWPMIGLTTIRQPIDQIIAASLELITAMINDPQIAATTTLFDCAVVERQTLRTIGA